jgi:hypothetical protein
MEHHFLNRSLLARSSVNVLQVIIGHDLVETMWNCQPGPIGSWQHALNHTGLVPGQAPPARTGVRVTKFGVVVLILVWVIAATLRIVGRVIWPRKSPARGQPHRMLAERATGGPASNADMQTSRTRSRERTV